MELQVAKWGNSMAMRLPIELVRRLGLKDGGSVHAQFTADGALAIRPAKWDKQAFIAEVRAAHEQMPMTESVIRQLRDEARY